jgi:LacI family transcriptional regulator
LTGKSFSSRQEGRAMTVGKHHARPTLQDVADAAGVSLKTASRVLNNEPHVTVKTQTAVTDAMKRLGYHPNELARGLKARRSGVIGVVVPFLSHSFVGGCVQAIHEEADRRGMVVVLALSAGDPKREEKQIGALLRRRVEGLILMSTSPQLLDAQSVGFNQLPTVVFDQPSQDPWIDSVLVPNREAAQEAVQHLLNHGYPRILAVGANPNLHTISERLDGYRAAMEAAGSAALELVPGAEGALSIEAISSLLSAERGLPDAIFTLNSYASVQVLHALKRCGLAIPKDMPLLCFDDFDVADVLQPSLTVVRQPTHAIGASAVSLLMERMNASRRQRGRRVVLPTQLVMRASCGEHVPHDPRPAAPYDI